MGTGKIGLLEAARLHQRHSDGITKNQCVKRRSRRGEVQRAGLTIDRNIKRDLGSICQGARRRCGHRDDPRLKTLERREKTDNLLSLAAVSYTHLTLPTKA